MALTTSTGPETLNALKQAGLSQECDLTVGRRMAAEGYDSVNGALHFIGAVPLVEPISGAFENSATKTPEPFVIVSMEPS